QLSGGERQRVMLARALAQTREVLLLDEPTNHLDVRHQRQILGLIRRLRVTAVAALHDMNLAAAFCDRLVVLKDGRVIAAGRPEAVLTPGLIRRAFQVAATVDPHPGHGRPRVSFFDPSHDHLGAVL
ncbi:MAG: ABC transporter ATP-binding protein, partial [Geminicoccaceae bacterium]